MVGEGVMLHCLDHPEITEVLSVSRKPTDRVHQKLREYLVPDFLALKPGDPKLAGYDACFFCAGVSSIGMNEADYTRATYDTTLTFAKALNPNPRMSFVYVSGSGTDSSEQGRSMWARVKGKTENDLMKLPFKQVFGYRVGIMTPVESQRRVLKYYNYFSWLVPVLKVVTPFMVCSMQQVADSMINAAKFGYSKNIIQVKDVKILAAMPETP
jgi:hypothetical protein